jgi:hypothetical protein
MWLAASRRILVSLLTALRAGVKTADKVTKPLQSKDVILEHYLGADGFGTKNYMMPVPIKALVDWRSSQVRTRDGLLTSSRSVVTFLDVKKLALATNGEGVGDFDRITLPDGTTGPILDLSGFIDAGTKQPFATEVMLG